MDERQRNELRMRAQHNWGHIAAKHGLAVVGADESTITVAPQGTLRPVFLISKLVLRDVRDINWPFEEAARRTRNAHQGRENRSTMRPQ